MQQITPFLMFDGQAEEAMNFYKMNTSWKNGRLEIYQPSILPIFQKC
jgi:predicted 3-demethylubiquinone-9 3-methyltransferase (glyoxalase superfamily)